MTTICAGIEFTNPLMAEDFNKACENAPGLMAAAAYCNCTTVPALRAMLADGKVNGHTLLEKLKVFYMAQGFAFLDTYAAFVESRLKGAVQTMTDLQDASSSEAQMLHIALGIVGELGEYRNSTSRANMLEELGDLGFFLQAASQWSGHPVPEFNTLAVVVGVVGHADAVAYIDRLSIDLLDRVKKVVIYRKEGVTLLTRDQHTCMHRDFHVICKFHGVTPEQLQRDNVAKLTKRYTNGYSNEAAQQRLDKEND